MTHGGRLICKGLFAGSIALIIFLVSLELLMRLGGFAYTQYQEWSNPTLQLGDKKEIRIVTLGESTTADGLMDGFASAWPQLLEDQLNRSAMGFHFKVHNLARGGASTSYLVKNFLEQISLLKPHIVISMMGVNDNQSLNYLHQEGWRSLRIVQLYFWLKSPRRPPPLKEIKINADTADILRGKIEIFFIKTPIEKVEFEAPLLLTELNNKYPGNEWFNLFTLAETFKDKLISFGDSNKAPDPYLNTNMRLVSQWLREAHDYNPHNGKILFSLLQVSAWLKDYKGLEDRILKSINAGVVIEPNLLIKLSKIPREHRTRLQFLFDEAGASIGTDKTNLFEVTRNSYLTLAKELKSRGIVYMAMQYPTASLNVLENIFSRDVEIPISSYCTQMEKNDSPVQRHPAYKNIYLISNENFKDPEVISNPKDFYLDMFAEHCGGHFGHTTAKGSARIANTAAQFILQNWSSIKEKF